MALSTVQAPKIYNYIFHSALFSQKKKTPFFDQLQ